MSRLPDAEQGPGAHQPHVRLADVDENMLEQLLGLALHDAEPDEVTPPLGTGAGWNPERIAWFRAYHRGAAAGLNGPAQEKSWAVLSADQLAGSIRLKRAGLHVVGAGDTEEGAIAVETGIWLGRGFRGQGVGTAALRLVLAAARRAGVHSVVARTTRGNPGAQRILTASAANLAFDGDSVTAVVALTPPD
ncbi:GNAT family N-acetyltransferase [Micrococcaceae bacterium Sec5.7]